MPNEIDSFFEGLPSEDKQVREDMFTEKPVVPAEGDNKVVAPVAPEEGNEPHKNRRHRRLEQQLQQERDARIRAEAEAEAARKYGTNQGAPSTEVDPRWIRMYGDTPESREAWKLQQDIFNDYKTQAKEEAVNEVRQAQLDAQRQEKEFETLIDSELEGIEDEFGVDVTSDAPAARKARREFLAMVEQASPKDANGTITAYADFGTVWEYYQLKQGSSKDVNSNARNKEIASRSMAPNNGASSSEQTITPGFDGWRKDYGMN